MTNDYLSIFLSTKQYLYTNKPNYCLLRRGNVILLGQMLCQGLAGCRYPAVRCTQHFIPQLWRTYWNALQLLPGYPVPRGTGNGVCWSLFMACGLSVCTPSDQDGWKYPDNICLAVQVWQQAQCPLLSLLSSRPASATGRQTEFKQNA